MSEVQGRGDGRENPGRIAMFLPGLYGGGAERVMVDLAQGFLERGYGCDLVLYRFDGPYVAQVPEGAEVIDLKSSRTISSLLPLAAYLRRRKPRVLISSFIHTNIIAAWAKWLSRVDLKLILTFHNMTSVEMASYTWRELPGISRFLMRRVYPRADNLVGVSLGVSRNLEEFCLLQPGSVKTIYNPCNLDFIKARAAEGLDHPWFEPGQPPVILGVGRLVEQKNFPLLIQAVAEVRKERRVRLMILGEGEEREALTRRAREMGLGDDFSFPGFLNNPFPYMAAADLLALPSSYEGFGLVLVEAMILGTPVVAADSPFGPAEVLGNGRFGELSPVGDASILAGALTRTLDNPIPAEILIRRAEEFSLDRAVEGYIGLIEENNDRAWPRPEQAWENLG